MRRIPREKKRREARPAQTIAYQRETEGDGETSAKEGRGEARLKPW